MAGSSSKQSQLKSAGGKQKRGSNSKKNTSPANRESLTLNLNRVLGNRRTHSAQNNLHGKAQNQVAAHEIRGMVGEGRPLAGAERVYFEPRFANKLDHVRLHTNSKASSLAQRLNADAFAYGNDIWFGKNQYQPGTTPGRHLLAHEIAHTLQQRQSNFSIQKKLKLGRNSDIAEHAADKAADAVVAGKPVPTLHGTDSAVIRRRQARSVSSDGDNVRIVEMDDGSRYRVTRIREVVSSSNREYLPPEVSADIDRTNLFITIEWCRGTRGRVRIGANVPEQALGAAQEIVDIIRRGGTAAEVGEALADTNITPFVDFVIARSGEWEIFGGANVTVGRGGVTGGGGRIGVRRGPFELDIRGEGDENGGRITGNATLRFGRGSEEFECDTQERVRKRIRTRYRCERFRAEQRIPRERQVPHVDVQSHFIYFHYAQDRIEQTRSQQELADLTLNLSNGYRVIDIEGFTSPEGPQGPGERFQRTGRGFEGNTKLAQDRANAAQQWIQQNCPPGIQGGCFEPGLTVTPAGRGERFTLQQNVGGQIVEVEGRPLAQHAVGEFQTNTEEARHRTPALQAALQRARTPRAQAALVYPLLRRAVVTVRKHSTITVPYEEVRPAGYRSISRCPRDVLRAARNSFNSGI